MDTIAITLRITKSAKACLVALASRATTATGKTTTYTDVIRKLIDRAIKQDIDISGEIPDNVVGEILSNIDNIKKLLSAGGGYQAVLIKEHSEQLIDTTNKTLKTASETCEELKERIDTINPNGHQNPDNSEDTTNDANSKIDTIFRDFTTI